jgi:GT2 family glycosyltransferase
MVTHGDRLALLRRTVPAILKTAYPFLLTVVTNAPSEAAFRWLHKTAGPLCNFLLLVNEENLGFPKACNRAWRLMDAPHTVHLGDDCLALEPDWLRKLVDIAECCPEVGIVGHSVEPVNHLPRIVGKGDCKRLVQIQPSGLGGIILVPERTRAICGYYNEELPLYGEEDALYGWKVRRAGLLCAYFDHSNPSTGSGRGLGRSFAHLAGGDDNPTYRAWKDVQREMAIPIRDQLIREYEAGRPLNS